MTDDEESLGLGNDDFSHFDDFNEEIPQDEDDVEYEDGESKSMFLSTSMHYDMWLSLLVIYSAFNHFFFVSLLYITYYCPIVF